MMMRKVLFFAILIFMVFNSMAQTEKINNGHFEIRYDKDVKKYALKSARILNFAWDKAEELGFNPPKNMKFNLVKSERKRLFVPKDKTTTIILEYTALDGSEKWINYVYGLCHEMGHVCMFHITPHKNNWMTTAYREGWAHIFGESMTVLLNEKYGIDVWPNPYDYLARLDSSMTKRAKDIENGKYKLDNVISEVFWKKLVEEKGIDKMPFFFRQIKSNKVGKPFADKKFREELVKLDVSNDLLDYFDKNKQYLIRLE